MVELFQPKHVLYTEINYTQVYCTVPCVILLILGYVTHILIISNPPEIATCHEDPILVSELKKG